MAETVMQSSTSLMLRSAWKARLEARTTLIEDADQLHP
jgi:hypothetical protein